MTKYMNYKDFESFWISKIPSHWDSSKIKYCFSEISDKNHPNECLLVASQTHGVIPKDLYGKRTVEAVKSTEQLKLVEKGNFVISLRSFQGGLEYAYYRGIISPAYTVLNNDGVYYDGYFKYLAKSKDFIALLQTCVTGIREGQNIDYSVLKKQIICIPPMPEQKKISNYLDWKTAEIHNLIKKEKIQLKLLRELLDSKVCDAIKSGKKNIRLDRIAEIEYIPANINNDEYYIKAGMRNRGQGIFLRDAIKGTEVGDSKFQHIKANCLMFSGQFAWEGAVYITSEADEQGIVSHRYYQIKTNQAEIPVEYLWAYFMTDKGNIDLNSCSHGAAGRNKPLNMGEVMKLYIPTPIKGFDYSVIIKLVRAIMETQLLNKTKIAYYDELKMKIISDAVTGKVDVRDVRIPEYTAGSYEDEDLDSENIEDDSSESANDEE